MPRKEGPREPLDGPCTADSECGLHFFTGARCGTGALKAEVERWTREITQWCKDHPKHELCIMYPGCPGVATTSTCEAGRCVAGDYLGRPKRKSPGN